MRKNTSNGRVDNYNTLKPEVAAQQSKISGTTQGIGVFPSTQNECLRLFDANLKGRKSFWDGIYMPSVDKMYQDEKFNFSAFQRESDKGQLPLTKEQLTPYLACYGGKHYHKLREAFARLDFSSIGEKHVEVIDWGCGQALATCVLLDWILENGIPLCISQITLIEPSSVALDVGMTYIQQSLPGVLNITKLINRVESRFDELKDGQILTNPNSIKIHLFSSILDVQHQYSKENYFSYRTPFEKIERCFRGENRFVCVSPKGNKHRLDLFKGCFAKNYDLTNETQEEQTIYGKPTYWREDRNGNLPGNHRFEPTGITKCELQFTVIM